MTTCSWEHTARAKQIHLRELIPVAWRLKDSDLPPIGGLRDVSGYVCNFLSPRELAITNVNAGSVLKNIVAGEWTCLEVTKAFCHRAAIAHQFVRWTI